MIRSSEVLPDPLAPVTASASPEVAVKSSSENTSRPPRTHLTPRPRSRLCPSVAFQNNGYRIAAARLSLWRCHGKDSKRFYKPELDAAHNPRVQAIRPSLVNGV